MQSFQFKKDIMNAYRKKEIVNMDLKQLDAKVNELLKGDINDEKK